MTNLQPHQDERRNRVFTKSPPELVHLSLESEEAHHKGLRRPIRVGITEVDQKVRTMFAGQLTYIVARPSNGKTMFLKHLARIEAEQIMHSRREDKDSEAHKQYVLFTSLEEPEDMVYNEISGAPATTLDVIEGNYDRKAYRRHVVTSVKHWPVWTQGYEQRSGASLDGEIPNFTVEQAYREVIQVYRDHGILPSAWFVDYLQLWASELRTASESQERQQIVNTSRQLKRVAKDLGIPIIVAAQAKQTVDDRRVPIPTSGDIEGSNQAFKDADVILTCCLPHMYPADKWQGGIEIGGRHYSPQDFGESAMILTLEKQRMGVGFGRWVVRCDLAGKAIYGESRETPRIPAPQPEPTHWADR